MIMILKKLTDRLNYKRALFVSIQLILIIFILSAYFTIFHFEIIKLNKSVSIFIFISGILFLLFNIYLFKNIEKSKNDEFIKNTKKRWENFTRMTGMLTHEIRNPLSTLSVNIDLIKERIKNRDYENIWLENKMNLIKREVDRLNNILENFSNIARGKKIIIKKNNLNKIIEDIVNLEISKIQYQNLKINIRLDLPEEQVFINCDEEQIKQVLFNLIKNAEEAVMEKGEGEIIIRVLAKSKRINIYIIDTGVGIKKENMDKVSDIFFSTKQKGSGIGLYVANRIIEQHNGTLKIKSFENKGTYIDIELPIDLA